MKTLKESILGNQNDIVNKASSTADKAVLLNRVFKNLPDLRDAVIEFFGDELVRYTKITPTEITYGQSWTKDRIYVGDHFEVEFKNKDKIRFGLRRGKIVLVQVTQVDYKGKRRECDYTPDFGNDRYEFGMNFLQWLFSLEKDSYRHRYTYLVRKFRRVLENEKS